MNNDEKIVRLQHICKPVIDWYMDIEERGEPDSSYIYDTTVEEFNNLSRGDFQEIIEILKPETKKGLQL